MTFQIINTTTKQPINLAEFDSKYCTINLVNCHTANKQLKKVISIQANQLDEMDSVFYNVLVK